MSRFDAVSVRLAVGFVSLFACFSAVADDDWTGAPDYYVEYVASTSGGNQYIDTGVIGRTGVKCETDMMWVSTGGDVSYLGARVNGGARY